MWKVFITVADALAIRCSPACSRWIVTKTKTGIPEILFFRNPLKTEAKKGRESQEEIEHLTHYHVLAVLAVGGLAKDVVLETVRNLRPGRLGGQWWGKAERGRVGGNGGVGADRRWNGWRAVVDERRARQQRRRWRRWVSYEIWGQASVAVGPLEEVLHAFAAHHGLEGQRAL